MLVGGDRKILSKNFSNREMQTLKALIHLHAKPMMIRKQDTATAGSTASASDYPYGKINANRNLDPEIPLLFRDLIGFLCEGLPAPFELTRGQRLGLFPVTLGDREEVLGL